MFKEPPIDRGSQSTTIFDLFEHIGILSSEGSDLVWTFPQIVEFTMFPLIFVDCIPSLHLIANLKILWLGPSVKDVLYLFLGRVGSVECMLSLLM